MADGFSVYLEEEHLDVYMEEVALEVDIVEDALSVELTELVVLENNASSGGQLLTQETAGEIIGSKKLVYKSHDNKVYLATNTDIPNKDSVVGLTLTAAILDEGTTLLTFGSITDNIWNFTPNSAVFLGLNGALTQEKPSSGVLLQVGVALTPTTMFFNIRTPITVA